MPLLIAALLALSAALVVLYPLLGLSREAESLATTPGQVADAAEREQQARQALREVEFDYTLGNLESDDYETLRGRYEGRALTALKARYQREQELDAQIERQLDALRQTEANGAAPASARSVDASTKAPPATSLVAKHSSTGRRPSGASVRDRRAPKRKGS